MNHCNEHRANLLLYLDNSLIGERLEDFLVHLESCPDCMAALEEERSLSFLLRSSGPLYSAPQSLRARVAAVVAAHDSSSTLPASEKLRRTPSQGFAQRFRGVRLLAFHWKPLMTAALVVILGLIFVPDSVQRVRAKEYVDAATETHRSYLHGDLPLQCHSSSPDKVSAWFTDKAPFHFQLPAAQAALNTKSSYWLTGARVVDYKGSPIALVAYETTAEKISLLVASSESAVVAGGEQVRAGALTFHYRRDEQFEVITWTNHGLTYALVSSAAGSAQHSCLVCHESMANQVALTQRSVKPPRH